MIKTVKTIKQARAAVAAWRKKGLSVGFVPTMGYLHAGHRSLIEKAASQNDRVVVSIFVNPMQFGPKEDLAKYPRNFAADKKVCQAAGAHLIFHPEAAEIYPPAFATRVEVGGVTEGLCGASRPGHFAGVATVVAKLFNIIQADKAYFGQKDAQQLAVIKRMTADLDINTKIIPCPIVREADGLALSSRNTYLNKEERRAALCLSHGLAAGRKLLAAGERDIAKIKAAVLAPVSWEPLAKVDYIDIVDAQTMQPLHRAGGQVLCAIAVFIGKTRLIDNFICEVKKCS